MRAAGKKPSFNLHETIRGASVIYALLGLQCAQASAELLFSGRGTSTGPELGNHLQGLAAYNTVSRRRTKDAAGDCGREMHRSRGEQRAVVAAR